jgi:hypothetical protein
MGEISRALDMGEEIVFEGRRLKISPLTFEGMAFFETRLRRWAYEAAERAAQFVGPARAEELVRAVAEKDAAGAYDWGGRLCGEAAQSPRGQRYLLFLMLADPKNGNGEVTEELAGKVLETRWQEALEKMGAANRDPFSSPAAPASPSMT